LTGGDGREERGRYGKGRGGRGRGREDDSILEWRNNGGKGTVDDRERGRRGVRIMRREKERLQGRKREPVKERVKWVSAETTEAESREGMKKKEEREEEMEDVILHEFVE
jgi:hypothetical protein